MVIVSKGKFYSIKTSGQENRPYFSLLAGLDYPQRGPEPRLAQEKISERNQFITVDFHVALMFQNHNLIDYLTF